MPIKQSCSIVCFSLFFFCLASCSDAQVAEENAYLDTVKQALQTQWPKNRTLNLVFHGHSVPAGYFKTPEIRTMEAYPLQTLKHVKDKYPFAVVNCINTSIGGEASESGAKRFKTEVLPHRPDVLFIDYALNDQGLGLQRAEKAWRAMIEQALAQNIKVILLTPTPDWRLDLTKDDTYLDEHSRQIRRLAAEYRIGLVDSYAVFKAKVRSGENVRDYMSQINHPNAKGHALVTELILRWF
ncbi:MAG: SGNH/GDSL hydrolase family protein [Planctomycetaceae bacterium]|jgi:lysophospholipase L1-like esterase|nr:SGNH/GDSL hydrolase family protein [Planctomycetaceae bacterium]